jgi:hypothetical protein
MHSNGFFLKDVAGFLGGYYTFIAIMNGVAALILWRRKNQPGWAIVWSIVAGLAMVLPSFTTTTAGPSYSDSQLAFAGISALALFYFVSVLGIPAALAIASFYYVCYFAGDMLTRVAPAWAAQHVTLEG